jgi:hypothetical protein
MNILKEKSYFLTMQTWVASTQYHATKGKETNFL